MRKTVLIVEDNLDALDLLVMYFEAQGFTAKRARDGVEGWNVLLNDPPSVILSDYLMPNMDGVELCEKIKKDHRFENIPFVLMTGTPHLPNSACQDMTMTKPLRLDRLVEYFESIPD